MTEDDLLCIQGVYSMLVLRRRCGEEIVIGEDVDIRVKVLSHDDQGIRLGIAAPKSVRVNRLEVHERAQNVSPLNET